MVYTSPFQRIQKKSRRHLESYLSVALLGKQPRRYLTKTTSKQEIHSRDTPKEFSRRSWFIIEDDQAILDSLVEGLQERGETVVGTTLTEDVVNAVQEFHPTIIVVDYYLAEKSGLEIIKEIRARNPTHIAATPILMSAYSHIRTAAAQLRIQFIEKPFSLDQLITIADKEQNALPQPNIPTSPRGNVPKKNMLTELQSFFFTAPIE
ncbi:response regulator [Candidatus Roizmanbacteria bacterium]|nr:response regulator [Candidatus Roizmanbacteria bacterium]